MRSHSDERILSRSWEVTKIPSHGSTGAYVASGLFRGKSDKFEYVNHEI